MTKWPYSGSQWTLLPFKDSQITCLISQSTIVPGITMKSADCRLRIPVFLITNIYFLISSLSGISADFQVSSKLLAAVPHQTFSSVSRDAECVVHKLCDHLCKVICSLTTSSSISSRWCRFHPWSVTPTLIETTGWGRKQPRSSLSVIWAITSPSPGYKKC